MIAKTRRGLLEWIEFYDERWLLVPQRFPSRAQQRRERFVAPTKPPHNRPD